jgi:hypothetical protein
VFRAYDAQGERLVAVKLFRLDLPPERVHQLVDAFERLIAAELGHPSLARPLATGLAGANPYLAVEYVPAESLDLAVREYGPAPAHDAVRVITQLAAALDFGAAVKVVHGAMHPRDILLSADDTRITGIGIARALERAGLMAPLRRPYTAPERLSGGTWDRRADIFTLAALSHELLWGRRITGTGQHVAAALTELPASRLTALQDAFARALSEDPSDRFDTALEFAEALRAAFDLAAAAAVVSRNPAPPAEQSRPAASIVVESRLPLDLPVQKAGPIAREAAPREQAARSTRDDVVRDEPTPRSDVLAANARADTAPRDEPLVPARVIREEREIPVSPSAAAADLELRAAEETRYDAVDTAPAVADERPVRPELRVAPSGRPEPVPRPEPAAAAASATIETPPTPRRLFWPIAAALALGVGLGFAGGYRLAPTARIGPSEVATNSATASTIAAAPPAGTAAATTPRAREATEVPVEEPKPVGGQGERTPADRPAAKAPAPLRPERRTLARPPAPTPSRTSPPAITRSRPIERSAAAAASGTAGRFVGGLHVESRPDGARVYLDGRLIGTTPLLVASVPAGEHAIRLERDGYRRWSSLVRIVAAEQNRVTASLER